MSAHERAQLIFCTIMDFNSTCIKRLEDFAVHICPLKAFS